MAEGNRNAYSRKLKRLISRVSDKYFFTTTYSTLTVGLRSSQVWLLISWACLTAVARYDDKQVPRSWRTEQRLLPPLVSATKRRIVADRHCTLQRGI